MKVLIAIFNKYKIQFIPSVANFLMAVFENKNSAKHFSKSLLESGIITRHLSGFGLNNCVRVTIGREDELKKLDLGIKEIFQEV